MFATESKCFSSDIRSQCLKSIFGSECFRLGEAALPLFLCFEGALEEKASAAPEARAHSSFGGGKKSSPYATPVLFLLRVATVVEHWGEKVFHPEPEGFRS